MSGLRLQNALVEISWRAGDRDWSARYRLGASCADNATHQAIYLKGQEKGVTQVRSKFVDWQSQDEPVVEGLVLHLNVA